ENNKININVNIQTGSIVRIRDFEVNGLKKTRKNVILREMTFKPGDVFDQRDIDESFRKLNNMGYFQNISPISLSPDEEGFVSLSTDLTEGRTGRFSGLLGYSPSEEVQNGNKLIGSLELLETNLFGTGRRISIKARLGSMDVYEFCYTEPWILGSPIDAGIQIRSIQRTDSLLNYKFSERELVLDGKSRIFRMINISVAITYKIIGSSMLISQKSDSNSISPFSNYLEDTKINNITEGKKYGVIFAIQRDSRDYYNNPTIGRLDRLSTEISSGDFKLFKVWLDLNQYFQIFNKQVLALGIHGAKSWGEKIPPTELFYLGGANTLRGYKEDIFRGKGKILANSEYRFLVGRDSNFFLFLDAGTVYNNKLEPIKIGYGLGIRLESASGMVSMDYGLAKGDSILNGKIHVSLGATF
ncbi:MAG: BamA/OMP85 family outer membrane protein, partial [bacterium]